jgi:hypothetical protein
MRMEEVMHLDTRDTFVDAVDCAASMGTKVVLFVLKILSVACEKKCDLEERGRDERWTKERDEAVFWKL